MNQPLLTSQIAAAFDEIAMTREQIQHRIDCAYDCDEPELVTYWEARLRSLPVEPVSSGQVSGAEDPLTDTAKLFGDDSHE